jgi:hypothetical protein
MSRNIEWAIAIHSVDGGWRATATGPIGGTRVVTMSVGHDTVDGARALLRAWIWLWCSAPSGRA